MRQEQKFNKSFKNIDVQKVTPEIKENRRETQLLLEEIITLVSALERMTVGNLEKRTAGVSASGPDTFEKIKTLPQRLQRLKNDWEGILESHRMTWDAYVKEIREMEKKIEALSKKNQEVGYGNQNKKPLEQENVELKKKLAEKERNEQRLTSKLGQIENIYNLLDLSPTATDEEVEKTYKQLALKIHPDKCGSKLFFQLLSSEMEKWRSKS